MGYTSGWNSLKEVKEHCLKGWSEKVEVIDHKSTSYGKHLWVAIKYKDTDKSVICLFLISSYKSDWGYKDMDESCGPYTFDCPLELLDKTTGDGGEHSKAWREKVRAYHANLKAIAQDIKIGEVVNVYGKKYRITEKIDRHYKGISLENGCTYRLKIKQIERLEGAVDFIMNAAGK